VGLAFLLLVTDSVMSALLAGSFGLVLWPLAVSAAAAGVLSLVFRQGRQLWRRAWETRTPPAPPRW
jgi:hypothetical protein